MFVKNGECQTEFKSLGEVDRSKNRPEARLGFVKPIRNKPRKIKNLIENKPSTAETGLAVGGGENGVRLRKEE